jgi:hypothetical protein
MAGTPDEQRRLLDTECPKTLAETVFYLPHEKLREQVEQYRIDYEAIHGKTDLTKRYTSTWPSSQQEWLIMNDTQRYFDGLPPFAKAFLKAKMQSASHDGCLDDMPAHYIKLFMSGKMDLGIRSR